MYRGAPSVVAVAVYEKRLLGDNHLGVGEIDLSDLHEGKQVDEWVPLMKVKSQKEGTSSGYFVRLRISIRYELMEIR